MRKLIMNVALATIFIAACNIAIAAGGNSANSGMFFFGHNSGAGSLAENSAPAVGTEESGTGADTGTDAGAAEPAGLSKNAKIAIGVGAGALAAGGIIATIIAASGDSKTTPPSPDENITISDDP